MASSNPAPVIRDAIYGGDAVITGHFTEKEARGLASVLENPLQTPVSIEEERSVSPTLGADSIRASISGRSCRSGHYAGMRCGLLSLSRHHRVPGAAGEHRVALRRTDHVPLCSDVAGHCRNYFDNRPSRSMPAFWFTSACAEELALGKSLKVAVQAAYEKAFSSIFDANVTTLITAVILFWKASGPVKGFAISLTLGILASLFTALIVGRNIFQFFVDTGRVKKISMMHLISSQNINFLGKGFLASHVLARASRCWCDVVYLRAVKRTSASISAAAI